MAVILSCGKMHLQITFFQIFLRINENNRAWAVGASQFCVPQDVGIPFGANTSNLYTVLQVIFKIGSFQKSIIE